MTIFIRKEQFSQNTDINSQLLGRETGIIHYRHVTNRVLGTKPDTVQFCPSVQVATHGEKRATTLEAHPSQHAPHYSRTLPVQIQSISRRQSNDKTQIQAHVIQCLRCNPNSPRGKLYFLPERFWQIYDLLW